MLYASRKNDRSTTLAALLLAGAVMILLTTLTGCHSAHVEKSVQSGLGDTDPAAQDVEFWSRLYGNQLIGNDDAMHGLILFFYNEDKCENYSARVAFLKEKGLLAGDFNEPAEQAFTRGTFAVALSQGLPVKGGVLHTLFPMSQRYAVRHLAAEDLFPMSSPNQTVSGTDFVGIVGRAEDYQRTQAIALPAPAPARDIEKLNPNQKR
jgi:hypothetical protein